MIEHLNYATKLFEECNFAMVAFNLKGEIIYWNQGAENFLGYSKDEVISSNLLFSSENGMKEFKIILSKSVKNENFYFKSQKEHKTGAPLHILFSATPLYEDEKMTGVLTILQNITKIKKAPNISPSTQLKENKRTFKVIRNTILLCLRKGKMTINQISNTTGINWKTVEKHLTYLIGRKLVEEVFSSEYVRIFELTSRGIEFLSKAQKEQISSEIMEEVY